MNKRRRIALVVLLVAVLGLAAWFTFHSGEPEYQGKTLAAWTRELSAFGHNRDPESIAESVAAVQHIGTNALPFLVADLQAKDLPWESAVVWISSRLPFELGFTPGSVRRRGAVEAFGALGTAAEPVIAKLQELMNGSNKETAAWAQEALSAIGSEKVVPSLMSGLTNSDMRFRGGAALCLGDLRGLAEPAVPTLVAQLRENDALLRQKAAIALGKIASQPQLVVPVLMERVVDTNLNVRRAAISALAEFGPEAVAVIPSLRAAAGSGEKRIRDAAKLAITRVQCEMRDGGIFRGPKDQKAIALVFTAHEYAEGGVLVLDELAKHQAKASFFFTGDFLTNTNFGPLVERILKEGHLVGPHSDKHLLYCSWDADRKTLVTREELRRDLEANLDKLLACGFQWYEIRYFLPAFEHYNRQIADWSRGTSLIRYVINFTPGTRSNADYTGEADKNFVSSQAIFDSIVKLEREDPHGLNGFILLLHIGSGPGRADKFHTRFGELLDYLTGKGYQFIRVDELLEPTPERNNEPAPKRPPSS